jgi:hypothetical protein
VVDFAGEPGMAVAWAQLIFNVVMVLLVLVLLRIFDRSMARFDSSDKVAQYKEGDRGRLPLRLASSPICRERPCPDKIVKVWSNNQGMQLWKSMR